ncbi:MAG: hypothetical protein M3443_17120 [Actinomycetota bacterium]|nr:hypothetical protein [Actinomycetota bacterium]
MTAYANRLDLANKLVKVMQQLRQAQEREVDAPTSVRSTGKSDHRWRVGDRLSDEDIRTLLGAFAQGTTKRALAERYGISESSVKRLVRRRRLVAQRTGGDTGSS